LIYKVSASAREFAHGYHTCLVERLHNAKSTLTNKSIDFWKSFGARVKFALASRNSGDGAAINELFS